MLLRSRPPDWLDALSVIDSCWLLSPWSFVRPYFRIGDKGHYRVVGRAAALAVLCLYRVVEPSPRVIFGSFHYEYLLEYPLLTPSIVAPEPLFEQLCSSKGSTGGRISLGVARATLVGVAPEALKESWTPLRAILFFWICAFSISLF